MNKLITIFVFFALSVSLFSQTLQKTRQSNSDKYLERIEQLKKNSKKLIIGFEEIRNDAVLNSDITVDKVDSLIARTSTDTSLYRFTYDNSGRLAGYCELKKENNQWVNNHRKTYDYYEDGKLKSQLNASWNDSVWLDIQRITYTYDAYGFDATRLYEYRRETGWQYLILLTTVYSSIGQILSDLQQQWDGSAWVNVAREQLAYNTLNQLISTKFEIWENGALMLEGKSEFSYTSWGDLQQRISEYMDYDGISEKYRETRSYNSERLLLQELTEMFVDSAFAKTARTTYQYEMNNRVHRRFYEENINDSLVNSFCEVDTLDGNGNRVIYYHFNWDSTKWVPDNRHYFTYNPKGKILVESDDKYSLGDWYKSLKEEYFYDAAGDLLLSFQGSYWENGAPLDGISFLSLIIDENVLNYLFIPCNQMYLYYKKVAVPVELASFGGSFNNGTVFLKWATSTETNNRGFEVERRSGNSGWVTLGFVNGAGTTAKLVNYAFEDKNVSEGKLYYRLKQIDLDGTFTYPQEIEINTSVIKDFSLAQNYPNPFNPSTVINYTIPFESKVKVNIYNATGQFVKELANGVKEAGAYNIKFDASQLSSGVYFYTIEASQVNGKNAFRNTKKMLLVK